MGKNTAPRQALRSRRQRRGRKKVSGTTERPRLAVYRSNNNISAQVIDDTKGVTVCSASTYEAGVKGDGGTGTVAAANKVGQLIGERAKAAGVEAVVFDRGGNRYHGRIAAVADAAREAGLEF